MNLDDTIKALAGLSAKSIADAIQKAESTYNLSMAKAEAARNVVNMSESVYVANIASIDASTEAIAKEAEAKIERLERERLHLVECRKLGNAGVLSLRQQAIAARKEVEGFGNILSMFRMSEELKPYLHLLEGAPHEPNTGDTGEA